MIRVKTVSRRSFLAATGTVGAGLLLGVGFDAGPTSLPREDASFQPNAWLAIDKRGEVSVWVARSEMGQGVRTSIPMIVAEELDADWSRIRVRAALADDKYGNMGTGGSMSIRKGWIPLRTAGATARAMLVMAAAKTWKVSPESCQTKEGTVIHGASGRVIPYGNLAERAGRLAVPKGVPLKDPKQFRIIGKPLHRLDSPEKVTGTATFGLDVAVPGMLRASLLRCPILGGRVKTFDAKAARAVPGVRRVLALDGGVAVVAETTWAALQGRKALDPVWEEGPNGSLGSEDIRKLFRDKARAKAAVARSEGDVAGAFRAAERVLEAEYESPFLAHSPMEPNNAAARVAKDRCEIWAPTQNPQWIQRAAAGWLRLPRRSVIVHTTLLGGGFGGRHIPKAPMEAVKLSKAMGAPVQVVWTREDETRFGYFRPASLNLLRGALDAKGRLTALSHRIVAPSISEQLWPGSVQGGLDESAVAGVADMPYVLPNLRVEYVMANTPLPVTWWRSVYYSQNPFANESFLDELAVAAGKDPYLFRRGLLRQNPRMAAVLDLAARKAGWEKPPGRGRGRGIACCKSFGSYAATVVEVSAPSTGMVSVRRVVCAVDCGQVVNPDTVAAQMESAAAFALSAALKQEITVKKGRVEQGNFDTYPMLLFTEMPAVEVHVVPSREAPGGIGEPGVPSVFPALGNALFAATGKRVRRLPVSHPAPAPP